MNIDSKLLYKVLYGALGVSVLALFLPWLSIIGLGSGSISGIDSGDGKLALGIIVVTAVAAFFLRDYNAKGQRVRHARWLVLLPASALAALFVYEIFNVSHAVSKANGAAGGFIHASVGSGLWLGLIAALVVAGSATLAVLHPTTGGIVSEDADGAVTAYRDGSGDLVSDPDEIASAYKAGEYR
jgi:hypothetical protein